MELCCLLGVAIGFAVATFDVFRTAPVMLMLWLLYLSVYKVGQVFLWFQWLVVNMTQYYMQSCVYWILPAISLVLLNSDYHTVQKFYGGKFDKFDDWPVIHQKLPCTSFPFNVSSMNPQIIIPSMFCLSKFHVCFICHSFLHYSFALYIAI